MFEAQKHINLLGLKVKDKVTGYQGVISSVSFDLYGCVQALITQGVTKEGDLGKSYWFDVTRLEISCKNPVMKIPNFDYGKIAEGEQGSAEKPESISKP